MERWLIEGRICPKRLSEYVGVESAVTIERITIPLIYFNKFYHERKQVLHGTAEKYTFWQFRL